MIEIKRVFFKFWFWLFGWRVIGGKPTIKKYVLIVAPHTSNWDFPVGLAAKHIIDLHGHFLGKDSLFKAPIVGWFMRSIGGIPVDRSKNSNLVDSVSKMFDGKEEFVIVLAPEGSRSYRPDLKTGFYRIAMKANVPIIMVGFDFKKKVVELRQPFHPTGDMEADLEEIKAYFRTVTGKIPEQGIR